MIPQVQKAYALVNKNTGEIMYHTFANRKLGNFLVYQTASQARRGKSTLFKGRDEVIVCEIVYGVLEAL